MDPEREVKEAFEKCDSLSKLGSASMELKDRGYNILLINRYRMLRHKELVNQSSKDFKQINKNVYNTTTVGDEVSSINISIDMLKSPVVYVLQNGGIVF